MTCKLLPFALLLFLPTACGGSNDGARATVAVTRGNVERVAVALGRIEPRVEIQVKSPTGGVQTRRFVQLGQRVEHGAPLVEVRPLLNDAQKLQAERALTGAGEAVANAHELRSGATLMGRAMLLLQGRNAVERMWRAGERAKTDAEAQLELLLDGSAEVDGKVIDFIVRSPVAGRVIELPLEEGEPVVPSSSFGSGTVVAIVADMDQPMFRGTVDEIDVGRLREGMRANITVGALPGATLEAELTEISMRAERRGGAVVFDVELTVAPPEEITLRSGYSAVARIVVERAEDVLVLPERVVELRPDGAFVRIDDGGGGGVERRIETGLSDALTVVVTSGLAEGDLVLER